MRLRPIAMAGLALGLVGVAVRAEGRALGRALLGLGDARVPEARGVSVAPGSGTGSLHRNAILSNGSPVDPFAVHSTCDSGSARDLTADVGRTPTLHTKIDSADAADRQVARGAGAGRIP
ncbi:hypothetical protein [Streptomyces sp. NRRL B-24085]|uniref:hypothetical protein n=1 Tax=Streptomyces sp. NRRL B-24085 TaxID=1709476 RepID=UPI0006B2FB34|nr:hypothetical protein [Streptomyces sp. NRRL B-24085]